MPTTFKEQYWKYTLIIGIIVTAIILLMEFSPFSSGILGACTIYVLVRSQMTYLTIRKKMKRSIAATLILLEVILCFVVPVVLVVWLITGQVQNVGLDISELVKTTQHFIEMIKDKTGYDLIQKDNISVLATYSTQIGQKILSEVTSFGINVLVMVFFLYFMLLSHKEMEDYVRAILPFNDKNKSYVLGKVKIMVVSNAIGIPLLAIIQGIFATIGYMLFDAPSPLLFGFITCFATIIPFVGTALIWVPLVLYIGLTGDWVNAIGLTAYALIVISNIDNLVRFMLQKKIADIHPLITVFGVIIGLSLFGFWGVIFGPLLLSLFFLCLDIFKTEYLDNKTKDSSLEKENVEI